MYKRQLLGTIPEKTDNIMVVDRKNKYLGVLPLAELLIRDQDTKVRQWMEEEPYVFVDTQTTEVAKVFEQRDLVSAAVVDKNGFLLGRITVDDVVDVIQKEAEQAVRSMAGLSGEEMFSPIIAST